MILVRLSSFTRDLADQSKDPADLWIHHDHLDLAHLIHSQVKHPLHTHSGGSMHCAEYVPVHGSVGLQEHPVRSFL